MTGEKELRAEIKRLKAQLSKSKGRQSRSVRAKVKGGGAIAQGTRAKSVGMGGVLIEGNVYMGPKPKGDVKALEIYRRVMMSLTSSLPLRGIDIGASDPTSAQKSIGLTNIYVNLDTTSPRMKPARPRNLKRRRAWKGGSWIGKEQNQYLH